MQVFVNTVMLNVVADCREVIRDAVVTTQGCVALQTVFVHGMTENALVVDHGIVGRFAGVRLIARQAKSAGDIDPRHQRISPTCVDCVASQTKNTA